MGTAAHQGRDASSTGLRRGRDRGSRIGRRALASLLLLGLAGCAQTAASPQPAPATASQAQAASADLIVCDAVETLFARVSAATSHWSPKDHPFDKVTAVTVKNLSQALVGQGRTAASTSLQTALSRTVTSLDQLDAAMDRAQRRADVLAAITGLRASYGTLKSVCSSDGSTPAGRSVGGSTPSTKAPTSPRRHQSLKPRGATCRKVQAIMVSMGQASAGWSPRSRPFDPRAAATFRALGIQLATLRGAPDPAPIRSAIHDNAQAFIGLADAMSSQDRKAVDTALASAQRAYSTIEQRCTLSVATPKGR